MSIGLSGILLPVKDMVMIYQFTAVMSSAVETSLKVMIYQFTPVMSSVVETYLKRFLHSLRSVVI